MSKRRAEYEDVDVLECLLVQIVGGYDAYL